jgi:hypothetical protein
VEYGNNAILGIITRYPGKPFTSTLFQILKNMPYLIGLIRSSLPESLTISRASGGVGVEYGNNTKFAIITGKRKIHQYPALFSLK